MNTRSISIIAAVVVIVVAVAVFAWTLVHAAFYAPDTVINDIATSTLATAVATSSEPALLSIPSLGISAKVQYLGINAVGNMQAPDNFVDVGWYKYGTVPGYPGSAVIDGHVDNGLSLAGVFKHLDDIQVGADVYVTTQGGTKLHFVVTDIETYPYDDAPAALIFAPSATAQLNLITCTGAWVAGKDTYDHRLVVFTKLASS